ncbi:MAG: flagellar basal body rod protein FlgC [Planctomycetes bacterium]|nr:flagellar basal body rod protein FlgC [Planctomycetota bacterium]
MFGSLDISISALVAQRQRMETISANIANADAITDAKGNYNPFRRRIAVFAQGDPATGSDRGVHLQDIQLDQSPLRKVFDPSSRFADADGYVGMPNVDVVTEQINAMEAQRAYEANITMAETTKSMMSSVLRLMA